jgi:hypothetical protein
MDSGSHASLTIEGAILLIYTFKTIGENDMKWSNKIIYMYSHSKNRYMSYTEIFIKN